MNTEPLQTQPEAAQRTAEPRTDLDTLLNRPSATFGPDMRITDLDQAIRFAQLIVDSGFAPKAMTIPGCVIAIQMGYEVGLSPMAAVQSIAVINGKPSMYGDACLALIRASGQLEHFEETFVGEPGTDERGVMVTVKRKGFPEASETFTVADAKRAKLWGNQGPWSQYPQRMLKFRARGFILRDQFGDVLKGLVTAEEAMDMPPTRNETPPTSEATPPDVFGATPEQTKPATQDEPSDPATNPSINDLVAAAVEAVGYPEETILEWCKTKSANHKYWCAGVLKAMTPEKLKAMAEEAPKVSAAIAIWEEGK